MATQPSFLQIIRQSGCVNLIDSHASLQSSQRYKLNTVAWVVEFESLLRGHGETDCTATLEYPVSDGDSKTILEKVATKLQSGEV